jgi:hypothetical protein
MAPEPIVVTHVPQKVPLHTPVASAPPMFVHSVCSSVNAWLAGYVLYSRHTDDVSQ